MLERSKAGELTVICNRFVMREGIDAPWLAHLILACVMGELQTYLQAGGRLLRAYPGLTSVTVQDHGGHDWRHGSLNADREWLLEYTPGIASGLRAERIRNKKCRSCKTDLQRGTPLCPKCGILNEQESIVCPQCKAVLTYFRCRECQWEAPPKWKPSRAVVQASGDLKEVFGDHYTPRRVMQSRRGQEIWRTMYFRSRAYKKGRTFQAAMALFARENKYQWPDRRWPFMPIEDIDFFRRVDSVPRERLR
jgi:predicted RNA-binding Zn-ribbon protein involved in translation (DUF1610 family)